MQFENSLQPIFLEKRAELKFSCHPKVSCYNICCKHADISLTPYDILRLKKHFKTTSTDFLKKFTVPYEMDAKLAGVKLKTNEQKNCLMLTDKGCSVYKDRPSACRYYPLGFLSKKKKEAKEETHGYTLIKESYCKGHEESKIRSINTYLAEQKLNIYERYNRPWFTLLVKQKSAGPTIGEIPEMSKQLFFMCSFDLDRFRNFVNSKNFRNTFQISDQVFQSVQSSDINLLKFSYKLMNKIFFNEGLLDFVEGARQKRYQDRKDKIELQRRIEIERYHQEQEKLKQESEAQD